MNKKKINLNEAETSLVDVFSAIHKVEFSNQRKIIDVFKKNKVESRHFYPSTGYGYGDSSREKLDDVFADVFGAQGAFVRPHFASATHALTLALRALLKPGDTMLSVTGKPYDTISTAIGLNGDYENTLIKRGVLYKEISLTCNFEIDEKSIIGTLKKNKVRLIFIQRSRGYEWRKALSVKQIAEIVLKVKKQSPETIVFADNCYGEFTQEIEPTDVGADVAIGSLIKNPGGGIAPTGAYIVGKKIYIDLIKDFFTSPGTGGEIGSYEANYRPFFQGLFMAPHTVAEALKGAALFAWCYERLGYDVMPKASDERFDITQSIKLDSENEVVEFCKSIQKNSPVDAHVVPEPWEMPGYSNKIIMAAGTFVQGASIELSADAPIKEPYIVYMQGGLTYAHIKIALIDTLKSIGVDVI